MPRGKTVWMLLDFSSENMEARKNWHNIFEGVREKNCQQRSVCPLKISFRTVGEAVTFSDEGKEEDLSLIDLS